MEVDAYGIFDAEEDDFITVDGAYRFYWSEKDAEKMLVAIGDPRYSVVKTQITRKGDSEGEE